MICVLTTRSHCHSGAISEVVFLLENASTSVALMLSANSELLHYGDFSFTQDNNNSKSPLISVFNHTVWSSSTFITWNALPAWAVMDKGGFSACNFNNQVPIIMALTRNQHAQIMWLRGSRPYHPPPYMQIKSNINRSSPPTKRRVALFFFRENPILKLWHTIMQSL